jgi:Zn-dependent peptidase ImmA (M78 family)/DNA-binding Xre family transcriptional regulator
MHRKDGLRLSKILQEALEYSSPSLRKMFDEKLDEYGLSKTNVENLLGIDKKSLDPILDGEAKVTDVVKLLKISEFLEVDIETILKMFFSDKTQLIKELDKALKTTFIVKNFDLKKLKKLGFLSDIKDLNYVESRICNFFQLSHIYEYDHDLGGVLYSKTENSFNDKMKDFWVKSTYSFFKSIDNPNEFSREKLRQLIPKIRPYTRDVENGLFIVARALFNIGITVIFQPYLSTTQVRGATFVIDDKPCIVITDLNKKYPTIWFALIHELHHALYDYDFIKSFSYHLSGEPDLTLIQEHKANEFALEYLIPTDRFNYIKPYIHNSMLVDKVAREAQIHPSLIYRRYQYEMSKVNQDYWGAFQKYFPNVEIAVEKLKLAPWTSDNIEESSAKIKEILFIN